MVPVTSLDNPFIFTETTANFQDLAIQGSVSYWIVDPVKAAEGFDFSARLSKSDVAGERPARRSPNASCWPSRAGRGPWCRA